MIDRPIRPLWPKGFRNEVQVICTILSADLVTPHDILCINGASASLMLSPLPFFGPIGAVRVGRIDGELILNPTHEENFEESALDLIVVGTKDGLTMVEAGADEVPEDVLLEALDLAHQEIKKLCEAQEDLRRQAGKVKWLDQELTAELQELARPHDLGQPAGEGPPRGRRDRRGARRPARARAVDGLDRGRHQPAHAGAGEPRPAARAGPAGRCRGPGAGAVRERPAHAHRGRAGLEGAEVGQAPSALRPDHRHGAAAVPRRSRDRRRRRPGRQGRRDEGLRQEGRGGDLQGPRPQEDRRRQAPPGRPWHGGDPRDRLRGHRQPAHARLGALPAGPDADHDALHARHRQGGSADRRPLARDGSPLHAPLQLPAVLGRGDWLHARPEAA